MRKIAKFNEYVRRSELDRQTKEEEIGHLRSELETERKKTADCRCGGNGKALKSESELELEIEVRKLIFKMNSGFYAAHQNSGVLQMVKQVLNAYSPGSSPSPTHSE